MKWQVYEIDKDLELAIGNPTTWNEAISVYDYLVVGSPDKRYSIGRV